MGTFYTDKVIAVAAYKILRQDIIKHNDNEEPEVSLHVEPTDYIQFQGALYGDYIWELGQIHREVPDNKDKEIPLVKFEDKELYKLVRRGHEWFILILTLCPDSMVYSGASKGRGLYFETELSKALGYWSYMTVKDADFTDNIKVSDKEIELDKEKADYYNLKNN